MCQLAPRHSLYSIIVLLFYCYTYWHTNWILYTLYLLIQFISTYNIHKIQGVSRLVDITAGGDFLGLCDQKCPYKHVSDFGRLRSYGNFLIPVHALVWTASYGNSWRVMYTAWWLIVCVVSIILLPDSRSSQPNDSLCCCRRWHFRKPALSTDQFKLKVISRS